LIRLNLRFPQGAEVGLVGVEGERDQGVGGPAVGGGEYCRVRGLGEVVTRKSSGLANGGRRRGVRGKGSVWP